MLLCSRLRCALHKASLSRSLVIHTNLRTELRERHIGSGLSVTFRIKLDHFRIDCTYLFVVPGRSLKAESTTLSLMGEAFVHILPTDQTTTRGGGKGI